MNDKAGARTPLGSCFRVGHTRALPVVPDWTTRKLAEGSPGRSGADRNFGTVRLSGAPSHVARDGVVSDLLRGNNPPLPGCFFWGYWRASCSPALASVMMLLARASRPNVARFLVAFRAPTPIPTSHAIPKNEGASGRACFPS